MINSLERKPLEDKVQGDKAKYSIFNMHSLKTKHAEVESSDGTVGQNI